MVLVKIALMCMPISQDLYMDRAKKIVLSMPVTRRQATSTYPIHSLSGRRFATKLMSSLMTDQRERGEIIL